MNSVPRSRYWCYGVLTVVGLIVDLVSKSVVFDRLGHPNGYTEWLMDSDVVRFRLYTSYNEGALWGMGQGLSWLFALLSVFAFAGVLYWLFFQRGAVSLWLTIALGLITAGTLGNLYDRLGLHGIQSSHDGVAVRLLAVRDFLHFQFFDRFNWAIFNAADIFLVTGAIMLVIQSFRADAVTIGTVCDASVQSASEAGAKAESTAAA